MLTEKIYSDEYGSIEFKRVPVQDGDVIAVRAGISQDAVDQLAAMLGATGRPQSIIVAVERMSDIKSLDPKVMSNYGWYQTDRVKVVSKFLEGKIKEERELENGLAPIYNGIYFMLTGQYYE